MENGTGVWDVNYTGMTSPQSFDVTQMDSTTWHWTLGGTVGGDVDPVVTNNVTLTNTTSSTQTYTVTQLIGVSPAISAASLTSGSIAGSITDNDNNGATLMTIGGTDLYTALIDGSAFTTLLADTFSVSALAGGSQAFPLAGGSFGLPGPSFPGPGVNTTIGIQLMFTLSAKDSVSFTSNFQVQPVPVPAALWLFGSGLLGLAGVARRRKR